MPSRSPNMMRLDDICHGCTRAIAAAGAGTSPAQGALHDQHIAVGELRCRSF
jgi:hypothetical protein